MSRAQQPPARCRPADGPAADETAADRTTADRTTADRTTADGTTADGTTDRHRPGTEHRPPGAEDRPPVPAGRPADPVTVLIDRYRRLCGRAVDPLEIAAGLEAVGVTDRVAARFRHRDVFSLAEELHARVPRDDGPGAAGVPGSADVPGGAGGPAVAGVPGGAGGRGARAGGRVLRGCRAAGRYLLPGAACAGAAVVLPGAVAVGHGPRALLPYAAATVVIAAALALCLRRGPLRAPGGGQAGGALCTGWLLGFAVAGGDLLAVLLGAPRPARPFSSTAPAVLTALALAVGPAALSARRFATRAAAQLGRSRGLEEFAAGVRPLFAAATAAFGLVLAALLAAAHLLAAHLLAGRSVPPGVLAGAAALGLLLFLARLLAVHGFPGAGAAACAAACAAEAAALAVAGLHRLPAAEPRLRPVAEFLHDLGPGGVQAAACGSAALALAAGACRVLARASAHRAAAGAGPAGPPASPLPKELFT
ncbi:hypothetical protein GCM10010406_03850 [Streptomyces thermolineatus]|uniref:Integral membrane protein n=1 Tax=Streptomyces thermolineatus TaxID=44033 RepID=A0ABN3KTI7_9ACTN